MIKFFCHIRNRNNVLSLIKSIYKNCIANILYSFLGLLKVPQTAWLKTMEIYSLTVLEVRSLK